MLLVMVMLSGSMIRAQHFTNYTSATSGLPSNNVTGVAVDANNHKWFGTQAGVAMFNDTTWITYTTANGLINNYINCITVDVNNNIWVGTDFGISKFDGAQWTSFSMANGLINNTVNYIAGAPDGSVWIGTGEGASNFDGTTWKNYTTTEGLPGNMISYVAAGTNGNIWLGTFLGGLSKFNGTAFTNFTKADSLPDNNIMCIAMGANNTKWIGTFYGVGVFDSQDKWIATYRAKDGMFNNFVQDIAMDSKGTMWLANYDIYTMDPGLSKKTTSGWRTFSIPDGLLNGPLKRIAVDKTDKIWIATGAGVSKLTDAAEGLGDLSTIHVNIYPNPATTEIHVDGLSEPGQVTINAVTGMEVASQSISRGSNTISLRNMQPGLYIIRCTAGPGVYSGKLIIR
jgi:ligand-binding sensor domain-containing protein